MPKSDPVPPVAAVRPHVVESPNGDRIDEYYWLRDDTRTSKEVLGYLEAENAYKAAMTAHTQGARGQGLRGDRRAHQAGRLDRARTACAATGTTRASRPARSTRSTRARPARSTRPSRSCSTSTRSPRATTSSRSARLRCARTTTCLAYAEDTVGRRQYTLHFKDLATGRVLPRPHRRTSSRHRLGERQPDAVLRREGPGDAARLPGPPPRARHAIRRTTRSSTRRRTRRFYTGRHDEARTSATS